MTPAPVLPPPPLAAPEAAFDAPAPAAPANTFGRVGRVAEWLFGAASLALGLSLLTAVPVGQVLVLGYMLEASGRVARSGRLRDGLIGVRPAARVGGAAVAMFALWVPLYVVATVAESARIIDPTGAAARGWERALTVMMCVYVAHVLAALARGGRVRNFLNPFAAPLALLRLVRGGFYADCRDRLYDLVAGWRLRYYFSLGVRGFVGAFAWLVVPVALLGQGHRNPALGIAGAALLAGVVLYLPFLQARFARDNQIRAYRALRTVRHDFRRAPLAFAFALAFQLLAACPLYLLKIEAIPRDLVFLEGFVFLLFMFPARLFAGWAYARAARRTTPRHFVWRWAGRFAVLPVVAAYVLVVFLSLHIGWHGAAGLFEQHAFLLPVPFTDLAGK